MTSHTLWQSKPTIHLTNWSSRKLHSGRVFTIMARPRLWERGLGTVLALCPVGAEVAAMRRALADRENADARREYREMIEARWTNASAFPMALEPGRLLAFADGPIVVADGDTLCCACARGAECHRRWAAPFLARAGWSVVLDGEVPDACRHSGLRPVGERID